MYALRFLFFLILLLLLLFIYLYKVLRDEYKNKRAVNVRRHGGKGGGGKKETTARGVPKRSPIQVLTAPDVA
jgi:hypothetical protein